MVRIAFVILGILEGRAAPLLPASEKGTEAHFSHLQSPHLLPRHGTTKSSITQYTVKPTLTVTPCDRFYLTRGIFAFISAPTIVSRINASNGTLRYFLFRSKLHSVRGFVLNLNSWCRRSALHQHEMVHHKRGWRGESVSVARL